MAEQKKYRALRETWLSHECRKVAEGEEFTTAFPDGMKLSANLELIKDQAEAKTKGKDKDPAA